MIRLAILCALYLLALLHPGVALPCSDLSGSWSGFWSETSCDGHGYSGAWTGYVTSDCHFFGTDNWDTVIGTINPSTKVVTGNGISADGCGSITMTGTFTSDFVSGNYTYSKGGGGSFTGSIQPKIPTLERAALIVLYNSTDGNNWLHKSGWKRNPLNSDGFAIPGMECSWFGVNCEGQDLSVVGLDLHADRLSGSIPPELGNLTKLRELYLDNNQLSGSIPPELGNLNSLQILDLGWLYGNKLMGSIPPELGNLTNLRRLRLGYNQLSGSIPSELGNLLNLIELRLQDNELIGKIPVTLMSLINLVALNIRYNHLYTNDPDLKNFLDNKQIGGDWQSYQTPPFIESKAMPWIPFLLLDE